jgi:hypothetical protein
MLSSFGSAVDVPKDGKADDKESVRHILQKGFEHASGWLNCTSAYFFCDWTCKLLHSKNFV